MKLTNIRYHRMKAGMTQQELAKALGVTQATITQWESGKTTPCVKRLKRIAFVLGCRVEELIA